MIIADSAQTEYCSAFYFPYVCQSQALHLTLLTYIKAYMPCESSGDPLILCICFIFLAKTKQDKTIVSDLTKLTIDFDWSKELSKRQMQNPQCCSIYFVLFTFTSLFFIITVSRRRFSGWGASEIIFNGLLNSALPPYGRHSLSSS